MHAMLVLGLVAVSVLWGYVMLAEKQSFVTCGTKWE